MITHKLAFVQCRYIGFTLSVRLFTSCPGHNFVSTCSIWIIFHTIVVHDPRSYLQGQGHSTHIQKLCPGHSSSLPSLILIINISHNCYPWPKGVSWLWTMVISPRSQCTHTENQNSSLLCVRTCLFIDGRYLQMDIRRQALLSSDNSCLLLCNHYLAFNKILQEASTTYSSVCKFRTCVTENGHPGLLFAYSFWLLLLYFWDLCVNKNGHHGLWFAYTFVIFPLQLLHRFLQITVGNVCSLITSVYIFFSVKLFLWQCVLLLHYCFTLILFIYIFQVTLMELQGYLKVTNQGIPA